MINVINVVENHCIREPFKPQKLMVQYMQTSISIHKRIKLEPPWKQQTVNGQKCSGNIIKYLGTV